MIILEMFGIWDIPNLAVDFCIIIKQEHRIAHHVWQIIYVQDEEYWTQDAALEDTTCRCWQFPIYTYSVGSVGQESIYPVMNLSIEAISINFG